MPLETYPVRVVCEHPTGRREIREELTREAYLWLWWALGKDPDLRRVSLYVTANGREELVREVWKEAGKHV